MTPEEIKGWSGALHDAVLLSVDLQWAAGTVTLAVRAASVAKQIIAEHVTRLECPREHPWGKSVCINELRLGPPPSRTSLRIEIEMQSGDVLVICAESVRLET